MKYPAPNRFRILHLIRHGQYAKTEQFPHGVLTPLGVAQARATAEHLERNGIEPSVVWCSTMSRAEQTARLIRQTYPDAPIKRTPLLRERMFPNPVYWDTYKSSRAPDDLLDRLARRHLRPARSERHELLVCHGNVIRAFVMRAIGTELERWITMHICHCSVTTLVVRNREDVRLLSYNEHTFLPVELQTFV